MMLEADIGIGISKKDDNFAAVSSDVSIRKFSHLRKLVLWYGRQTYIGLSNLALFVFYRAMTIMAIQVVFTMLFGFVSVPVFGDFLTIGFVTVFTCLPVFQLLFNEEYDIDTVMEYPQLFRDLRKGRSLNLKEFLKQMLWAIF